MDADTSGLVTRVAQYYDRWQLGYRLLWSPNYIHYGHWTPGTRSHEESLENANALVADGTHMGQGDYALDAGCGVAGPALYMARRYGSRIHGVTISQTQFRQAQEKIRAAGLEDRVEVSLQDYCKMSFADESFTVVYGLESVCYAEDKAAFLREAFRVLQRGGRIAVMDAFLVSDDRSADHEAWVRQFLPGWQVPNLASLEAFARSLGDEGFVDIRFVDCSANVRRSTRRVAMLGYATRWPSRLLSMLHVPLASEMYRQAQTCIAQYWISKLQIAKYGMFLARKSSRPGAGAP